MIAVLFEWLRSCPPVFHGQKITLGLVAGTRRGIRGPGRVKLYYDDTSGPVSACRSGDRVCVFAPNDCPATERRRLFRSRKSVVLCGYHADDGRPVVAPFKNVGRRRVPARGKVLGKFSCGVRQSPSTSVILTACAAAAGTVHA